MIRLLLAFFLLISQCCFAQNYRCFTPGTVRFFTNSNNYVRAIRIDSIRVQGSDTIYYPFHTPRGRFSFTMSGPSPTILDKTGGSWLGKNVIGRSGGIFLFDNMWHDTVVINAQAVPGDSWIFYNDTTKRYYKATVVVKDTATILGVIDSIKKIMITAFDDTGAVPSDPVNGFEIVLSKDYGFSKAIDLYTFPYHAPDSQYALGLDWYLNIVAGRSSWSAPPNASNSEFELIPFANPSMIQVHDRQPGDVFEYSACQGYDRNGCTYPSLYYLDSVAAKNLLPGSVQYDYEGWVAQQHDYGPFVSSPLYTFDVTNNTRSDTFYQQTIVDNNLLPEEYHNSWSLYYYPHDTTYCYTGSAYTFWETEIIDSLWQHIYFENSGLQVTYKEGLGKVHIYAYDAGTDAVMETKLRYYRKSGVACGTIVTPVRTGINDVDANGKAIVIYPTAASGKIVIQAGVAIGSVVITDMLGRILFSAATSDSQMDIDVSGFAPGLYFVRINGLVTEKFIKQ